MDPGLPLVGQIDAESPAPVLTKRYVVPEVIVPPEPAATQEREVAATQPTTAVSAKEVTDGTPAATEQGEERRPKLAPRLPRERRTSVNQFLSETTRAVVSRDAGARKTTILRYLALQILADKPDMDAVNERFAGYVPV